MTKTAASSWRMVLVLWKLTGFLEPVPCQGLLLHLFDEAIFAIHVSVDVVGVSSSLFWYHHAQPESAHQAFGAVSILLIGLIPVYEAFPGGHL
jgi:hypothetical protein